MLNNRDLNVDRNTVKSPVDAIGTAIILAAGMGVRLKERGKLTPKGCIRLGEKTIVEESVLRLLSGLSKSSDEVFVETQDGHLVAMSKNRDHLGDEILGELVGI